LLWQSHAMARDDPTIYMRIPAELKAQLDAAAKENRRSFVAEVSHRLQQSFQPQPPADAQFLIAKWNRDLLDVELEKQTLRMHLKEVALALFQAALSINTGHAAKPNAVAEWLAQVNEAFEASEGVELDAKSTLEELEQANRKLDALAEQQGIVKRPTGGIQVASLLTPKAKPD
jgi:hypothetical protein